MRSIRKQMLACHDSEKINFLLMRERIGYLGLVDQDGPYVVPVNFVWQDGRIYFHGAGEGRKADIMQTKTAACFTVCEEYGTMAHSVPAHTSTAYMSVMLFGQVERLSDLDEATEAMQKMLDKYVPGYYDRPLSRNLVEKYRSSLGSRTVVFCLKPDEITAKENPLVPGRQFIPGQHAGER